MSSKSDSQEARPSTRGDLMALLNHDLAREYQSVLAAVVYSQVLKGSAYQYVAAQVRRHAAHDLEHALLLAGQIDYLGGMPVAAVTEAKLLARQTGHPVGIRRLCSGTTTATVLKTPELLADTFDSIAQPGDAD